MHKNNLLFAALRDHTQAPVDDLGKAISQQVLANVASLGVDDSSHKVIVAAGAFQDNLDTRANKRLVSGIGGFVGE